MSSVTIEDHGNKQTGLKIIPGGRALVSATGSVTITEADNVVITSGNVYNINAAEIALLSGKIFTARRFELATADDAYHQLLMYTGTSGAAGETQAVYTDIGVGAGGDSIIEIYENPTITSSGTDMSVYNKNRLYSDGNAIVSVYHTPTVTSSGTRLSHKLLPAGTGFTDIGEEVPGIPWKFRAGEDYLISVQNIAGATQPTSIMLNWRQ